WEWCVVGLFRALVHALPDAQRGPGDVKSLKTLWVVLAPGSRAAGRPRCPRATRRRSGPDGAPGCDCVLPNTAARARARPANLVPGVAAPGAARILLEFCRSPIAGLPGSPTRSARCE